MLFIPSCCQPLWGAVAELTTVEPHEPTQVSAATSFANLKHVLY